MYQEMVVAFLNERFGLGLGVSPMYGKIEEWREWLEGNVKGFHSYFLTTDLTSGRRRKVKRHKTNMLLRGAEDWASVLLNEKTRIVVDDRRSAEWLMGADGISGVLGENDFWRCGNELVATSRWSGTGAFELYVKRMDVGEDSGRLLGGSGIGVNYLGADQIIPISWDNGVVREAAFVSERRVRGERRFFVSAHLLTYDGTYDVYGFTLDESGKEIRGEGYAVRTGSPYPWFALIRKSGVNVFDYGSPFGVSIISGAEDVLRGLDAAFDNFVSDFLLGRKMVLMNKSLFNGADEAPQESGEQLFINAGDKTLDGQLIQEYNPALRVEDNARGLQKMLDLFSLKIGLGAKRYQFDGSGQIKTATEYTGERQDMVQNAYKEMISVEAALKAVIRGMLWIGRNVLGADVDPEALVTIQADDSYIIDKDQEKAEWKNDISLGIRSRAEYRMHFFGESADEAAAALKSLREAEPSALDLLGE